MAVTTSGSGQESTGGFVKVTGFLKVKDVIVNPNKEELVAYGITWKEPNYEFQDSNRGKASIVDFYFRVDESNFAKEANFPKNVILNTRVYLFPNIRKAQTGKTQYINKYGNFIYADSVDTISEKFDKEGLREAYDGEEQLISFIKAWGDMRKGDSCTLDTMDQVVRGNITELKQLEKIWDTHKLKVLVGLVDSGDGKFQQAVYSREYWRVFTTKIGVKDAEGKTQFEDYVTAFPKFLAEERKDFTKADKLTFVPKIWNKEDLESVVPDANPTSSGTSSGVSSAGLF
jgi:hypothetical protein